MNDEILKLIRIIWPTPAVVPFPELEAFYRAAFNAGLEAAAKVCNQRFIECMEPEARELRDAIRALEKSK